MRILQISIDAKLFPVKYLNNRVITIFNVEVCSPPPWTLLPTYICCVNIPYEYTAKGFAGSRGWGTYFIFENGDDPIFLIFDRK